MNAKELISLLEKFDRNAIILVCGSPDCHLEARIPLGTDTEDITVLDFTGRRKLTGSELFAAGMNVES